MIERAALSARMPLAVGMIVGLGAMGVGAAAEGAAPESDPLPDKVSSVSTAPRAVCTPKKCKIRVKCEARDPESGPACIFTMALVGPQGRLITRPSTVTYDPENGTPSAPWPQAKAVLMQSADPSVRVVSRTVKLRTIPPGRADLNRDLKRGKRKLAGSWEARRGEGFVNGDEFIYQYGAVKIKLKGRH